MIGGWVVAIVAVIAIIIAYAIARRARTSQYVVRGMIVNVMSDRADSGAAVAVMRECNGRMVKLLDHLRRKYKIGATDAECEHECALWIERNRETREIVRHLLRDFNYEAIYEHRPRAGSQNVAYSIGKGRTIMLCLRDANRVVDVGVLMFVVLHEAAHIANYNEWGHGERFWSIFKYLLAEAVAVGVYVPEDYARAPRDYCGFNLNHNPLFDARIEAMAAPA
ncbi:MAG: hypothetical protein M0R66_06695 [Candidatus Omnitrophica bacterium]|jgi:hypothetical protein|nr:hypothetical protein [Candidatus Omnitrophota bacterium]